MRMVANNKYQGRMTPEKQQLRVDPFDNQGGEIERTGAEVPFTMRQIDGDIRVISVEPC